MASKIKLVISDIHLGLFQQFASINAEGINTRLWLQFIAIRDAFSVAVSVHKAKVLIINGDIFHVRGFVEVEAYNMFLRILSLAVSMFDEVIVNTGNHDITHENTAMFNSLNVFSEFRDRVTVVQAGNTLIRPDLNSVFFGYTNKKENEELEVLSQRRNVLKYDLYTHQSIVGVQYRSKVLEEGFSLPLLHKFKRVFNGHIHEPSRIKNVHNLGSMYPIDFGDVGHRYYYIVSDGRVDEFETKHPLFITVKDQKHIKKDENFYRIVSDKKLETGDNVKVVIQKKLLYDRGVDYSSPSSVIASYCNNVGKKKLIKQGIKMFKEANK